MGIADSKAASTSYVSAASVDDINVTVMGKNAGVKRRTALVLVVATLITACGGGGGGGAKDADDGATTEDCAGVPAAELAASGGLCSDTGLRPVDGGFS
ncbi:MAG: hypothetical protein RL743_859, partial [Actinomycetota bacterium]